MDESDEHKIRSGRNFARDVRLLSRSAEQVFVDDSVSGEFRQNLGDLFNGELPKGKRAAAGIKLLSEVLPQQAKDLIKNKLQYTQDKMPFYPEKYRLVNKLGYGGMNDVFLLKSWDGGISYVLKVSKMTLGEKDIDKLVSVAKQQKADFEAVSKKFTTMPEFVPPEYFMVAHGPRRGEPSMIAVQPFIGGNIKDVFEDFSRDELGQLISVNSHLRNQFRSFVSIVKENPDLVENEFDLFGKCNLAIVGKTGEERLLLLDAHSRNLESRSDNFKNAIAKRVDYLDDLTSSE